MALRVKGPPPPPAPAIWSPDATNAAHLSIHFQRSATAGRFWVKNRVESFKVYSCYIENEEIQSVKNIRCVSVKYIELHPYISTWEGNLISKCVLGLSHSAPTQTEIPMFFITLSVKLHGGEIWCFSWKICIFKQHKYRNFPNLSTRAFSHYKLKFGKYIYIVHELRVKVVNFEINYLHIDPFEKFENNLAYK